MRNQSSLWVFSSVSARKPSAERRHRLVMLDKASAAAFLILLPVGVCSCEADIHWEQVAERKPQGGCSVLSEASGSLIQVRFCWCIKLSHDSVLLCAVSSKYQPSFSMSPEDKPQQIWWPLLMFIAPPSGKNGWIFLVFWLFFLSRVSCCKFVFLSSMNKFDLIWQF